ncbi:MAG: SAM-dependent methyltransferase [Bryobacter sp.]|nr:SAM-dependent methyltransferase [Bryobacter sp.]
MDPLAAILVKEIETRGPIPFSRFMELALYHPDYGYYRGSPFGRAGDFYTAAQLQPAFGLLVRELVKRIFPATKVFVDWGAGREDLREAIQDLPYCAVQIDSNFPETQSAFLFANELFDALPVEMYSGEQLLHVDFRAGEFGWWPHEPVFPVREVRPQIRQLLAEAYAKSLSPACMVILDYGYRGGAEQVSGRGTLLAYRQHRISENVLAYPGQQDLTAHVDWDDLQQQAIDAGWQVERFLTLSQLILSLGEEFLAKLQRTAPLQAKSLLFDFGACFDALVLRK